MEAKIFNVERTKSTFSGSFKTQTLPVSDLKSWTQAKVAELESGVSSAGRLSLAVLDASQRNWSWEQRTESLQPSIHSCLEVLNIPTEYCWFTSALVKHNSFSSTLDAAWIEGTELQRYLTYVVACDTFGIAWLYHWPSSTTIAIAWSSNEEHELIDALLEGIKSNQAIIGHPLLLGLHAANLILTINKKWLAKHRRNLFSTQTASGYHAYDEVGKEQIAPISDPAELSIKVSGIASHIAICELCLRGLRNLTMFLVEENASLEKQRSNHGPGSPPENSFRYVAMTAKALDRISISTLDDIESCQKKTSIVIQGLFSRIAKKDQDTSISIAKDSMEIARDSKRDSTSMKAIAGVTMVFLPGTFLAV